MLQGDAVGISHSPITSLLSGLVFIEGEEWMRDCPAPTTWFTRFNFVYILEHIMLTFCHLVDQLLIYRLFIEEEW